jgi:hypothetical protein
MNGTIDESMHVLMAPNSIAIMATRREIVAAREIRALNLRSARFAAARA